MRYFLDTEYNGFGGSLISLALVPEHGDQEFYAVLPLPEKVHPWVERNVLPYLSAVPPGFDTSAVAPVIVASHLSAFLEPDSEPVIVADWPDDIALFCYLLVTGEGEMVSIGKLRFELACSPGFSTAAASRVPHNALHDARALRDFMVHWEG